MNSTKNIVIAGLVAALLTGAIFVVMNPAQDGRDGANGQNGLGALSSPDVSSPYFSFGGVREWATSAEFKSASTTCAVQSPAATTTLVSATARFDSIPDAASTWELGNATTAYATTTSLGKFALGSGAKGDLIATTSVTALTDGRVAPSTYINLKIATTTAGTYSGWTPVGRCNVVFREI